MIPQETIKAFARTICEEARRYGFDQIDTVRLINAMLDIAPGAGEERDTAPSGDDDDAGPLRIDSFPLESARLRIRLADPDQDLAELENWIGDDYGRHFLLSCATAQSTDMPSLLANERNAVGIVMDEEDRSIGAVAYLDIDPVQRRAELRKLIGDRDFRGKGYAAEATRLWIEYGARHLKLEKIYVSTLQTHLRNIRLNESVGFRVEGVLHREVRIGDERHDVLRMGLCLNEPSARPARED